MSGRQHSNLQGGRLGTHTLARGSWAWGWGGGGGRDPVGRPRERARGTYPSRGTGLTGGQSPAP
jgi:hypothetical protein